MKFKIITKREKILRIVIGLILIMSFGAIFNSLAITENSCKMPVYKLGYSTETHFSYDFPEEVNYSFLADRISIKSWKMSLGDVMFFVSIPLITFFLIVYLISVIKEVRIVKKDGIQKTL